MTYPLVFTCTRLHLTGHPATPLDLSAASFALAFPVALVYWLHLRHHCFWLMKRYSCCSCPCHRGIMLGGQFFNSRNALALSLVAWI